MPTAGDGPPGRAGLEAAVDGDVHRGACGTAGRDDERSSGREAEGGHERGHRGHGAGADRVQHALAAQLAALGAARDVLAVLAVEPRAGGQWGCSGGARRGLVVGVRRGRPHDHGYLLAGAVDVAEPPPVPSTIR